MSLLDTNTQDEPSSVVSLPPSTLRRVFTFSIAGGIGLGIIIYGLLRAVELNGQREAIWGIVNALLVGGLVGLALYAAVRQGLRQAAHDLHHHAVELTNANLPEIAETAEADEMVYMRDTLSRAIAAIPRPDVYPRLTEDLVRAPDFKAALAVTMEHLSPHMPLIGAALLLYDHERNQLVTTNSVGALPIIPNVALDLDATAIGRALREQRSLLYTGAQTSGLLPIQSGSDPPALFCLPLVAIHDMIGMLCFAYRALDMRLNDDQRGLARGAADLYTLSAQRILNNMALARERERLAAFERLGNALNLSDDLDRALNEVLTIAARVTDAIHGTLLLLDEEELNFRQRISITEGKVSPLNIVAQPVLRHGLAGWVIRERRGDVIEDTERDSRWLPVPGLNEMRSVLAVPLLFGSRVLGVITLAHPNLRHFTPRGLALVAGLAAYAANLLARRQLEVAQPDRQLLLARRLFRGHIAPPVIEQLLKNDPTNLIEAQNREVTAVYAALHGVAQHAHECEPQILLDGVLTPFFTEMATIAFAHNGYLERRDDGAVLLLFGYPHSDGKSDLQALQAALAIQAASQRLRLRWRNTPLATLGISVGVARGSVAIGATGPETSRAFSAVGPAINQAARLQELARRDEVLVADKTLDQQQLQGPFRLEPLEAPPPPSAGMAASLARLLPPT